MKITKSALKQLIKEELDEMQSPVDQINTAAAAEGRVDDMFMNIFRSLYDEGREIEEVLESMEASFNRFKTLANRFYR